MTLACAVHNFGLLDVKLALLSTWVVVRLDVFVLTEIGRHLLKDPSGFDSICCPVNTPRTSKKKAG